jgi:hypothetical protein
MPAVHNTISSPSGVTRRLALAVSVDPCPPHRAVNIAGHVPDPAVSPAVVAVHPAFGGSATAVGLFAAGWIGGCR